MSGQRLDGRVTRRGLAVTTKTLWDASLAPLGGRGSTTTGVFSSRGGPGEGVVKNLAKRTRFYGLAMRTSVFEVPACVREFV
jgi:hypothetical protein